MTEGKPSRRRRHDGERKRLSAQDAGATPARDLEELPSTDMEWVIAHIRKLEIAVDEILWALKAGGYSNVKSAH